jgi:hypothetical protein
MASLNDYRPQLRQLLTAGFQRLSHLSAVQRTTDTPSYVETLANRLDSLLKELVQQDARAQAHLSVFLQNQAPHDDLEPTNEFALGLHYLHSPPAFIKDEIANLPDLQLLWDSLAAVAPPSTIRTEQLVAARTTLQSGSKVCCDNWGGIWGVRAYEQLDVNWLWTLKNVLMNHLQSANGGADGRGIRSFQNIPSLSPISLESTAPDQKVRIAVIGDWGSGAYELEGLNHPNGPAFAVMDTLAKLEYQPDYIIHLGDTYYSGTASNRSPFDEEKSNLLDVLQKYTELAKQGHCFTLNSNHEMYGGAYGYFDVALKDPLFGKQAGCSYFALQFENWIIVGIDSAYFDPSGLYMDGGLGEVGLDPQFDFLRQIAAEQQKGKKVILMSHHTGISTDGSQFNQPLWNDITCRAGLTPDYWYWGHTHLGMVYNGQAASGAMKTRCIGHSSMPFAIPPKMKGCANVSWYAQTPLNAVSTAEFWPHLAMRAKNGFAMITLAKNSITEEVFEVGNASPVWGELQTLD